MFDLAMSILQCQLTDFTCTFLEVPLSIRKLPKPAMQLLVDKVAKPIYNYIL